MADRFDDTNGSFWGGRLMWTLSAMLVVIVILAVLALRSPISEPIGERTIVPTLAGTSPAVNQAGTPEPEVIILAQEDFLDPEEIGHTGSIIFWSTMLLLIVVIGTLREAILRKK